MKAILFLEALLAFAKRNRRYLLLPVAIFCLYMVYIDARPPVFWAMAWVLAANYSLFGFRSC